MFCIECGASIPENSKFCPHCGKKQIGEEQSFKEKLADTIIDNEITKQIVESQKKSINYSFLRQAMGWYLAWVLLHLALLLIFSKSIIGSSDEYGMDRFWPFSERSKIENYDFREFLVYTIFPLAILVIYSMIENTEDKIENVGSENKE
jgi:hypothetical protein